MQLTPSPRRTGSKSAQRKMIGLRMDDAELKECKQLAAEDNRSAAQFALMMYRRGLQLWQDERQPFPASQAKKGCQ